MQALPGPFHSYSSRLKLRQKNPLAVHIFPNPAEKVSVRQDAGAHI
jgi:uncharacterized protein YqiB (DUF1249 family)